MTPIFPSNIEFPSKSPPPRLGVPRPTGRARGAPGPTGPTEPTGPPGPTGPTEPTEPVARRLAGGGSCLEFGPDLVDTTVEVGELA